MTEHSEKIARNTAVVAGATFVSRLLGFLRDVIVAFALGAGLFADAFFVAFRIPNLLRRLFGEGSLTMVFIPVFSQMRQEHGEAAAKEMARSALAWLMVLLCGITLLVQVFAGGLTFLIAPGFVENSELFGLTVKLLRICFPYIIFISGVALCMGILNASNHFFAPAFAPVVLNLALIGAALLGYFAGLNVAVCMAWGVLLGGLGQWLLQQPFLRARGFSWSGPWSWRNPGVTKMALLMLPTVLGAAVYQINILLGTLLASFLPTGSVSYLYYADRLVQFPLGVFGIAVSVAALPGLSALAAENRIDEFASTLKSSQGLSLFIALPSTAGLLALAAPIVALLFQRGAFTPEAVEATSRALLAFAAGLPFIALARPLAAAFYALHDTRTPVKIAIACLILNIGLGLWLMHPMKHVGLALAVSLSSAANFLLLNFILAKRLGQSVLPGLSAMKSLLLSALIGLGAWTTAESEFFWLLFIPAWVVLYVAASLLLDMEEARLFMTMLKSRGRGRGKTAKTKGRGA